MFLKKILSTPAFKQCSSKGECFCGAAGHTPECPDLVAGLAAPAMQVQIHKSTQMHKNTNTNSSHFFVKVLSAVLMELTPELCQDILGVC